MKGCELEKSTAEWYNFMFWHDAIITDAKELIHFCLKCMKLDKCTDKYQHVRFLDSWLQAKWSPSTTK
jgi:hypothetical protein